MNGSELARAVRGPVTLIALGMLFALDHFTAYSFGRTWPVLLIVFGVFTLLGRVGDPRPPYPPAAPGPGGAR